MSKTTVGYSTVNYRIRILLGTLFALILADGLISHFIVAQRLGHEVNPLLEILVVGEDLSFISLKVAAAISIVFIFWFIYRTKPNIAAIFSSLLVILYAGITYWNLLVFFIA